MRKRQAGLLRCLSGRAAHLLDLIRQILVGIQQRDHGRVEQREHVLTLLDRQGAQQGECLPRDQRIECSAVLRIGQQVRLANQCLGRQLRLFILQRRHLSVEGQRGGRSVIAAVQLSSPQLGLDRVDAVHRVRLVKILLDRQPGLFRVEIIGAPILVLGRGQLFDRWRADRQQILRLVPPGHGHSQSQAGQHRQAQSSRHETARPTASGPGRA